MLVKVEVSLKFSYFNISSFILGLEVEVERDVVVGLEAAAGVEVGVGVVRGAEVGNEKETHVRETYILHISLQK